VEIEMEVSDIELIKECLDGKQEAFTTLVTRYKRFVYSIVYKYFKDMDDVNDISQEAFLKIYKSLDRYNPEYKFSTWIAKITVNVCLDLLRKNKMYFVPMEEVETVLKDNNTPEAAYIEKERTLQVQSAINKLPEKYRAVVLLYHEDGASYKEISEMLNQPLSIIKNRLHRARLMLRESFSNMEGLYRTN
jgi:RNA polymerase sigma-70 factor (ECF subfamily)